MIKIFFICIGAALLIGFVYYSARFMGGVQRSTVLIEKAKPYTLDAGTGFSMLVLGDSTAVGVGADTPGESVPGRVAKAVHATHVENYAVTGAVVDDLPVQIIEANQTSYDLILIQIGANDITHLHPAAQTAQTLAATLKSLPPAKNVIVISAGDVGTATIIPPFLSPLFSKLNLAYHTEFEKELQAEGITYVNLGTAPGADLFKTQPAIYLAADGFHPSSAGYELWFKAIESHLSAKNSQ
jgi:lysophospholipase L1-like esterase